MTELLFLSAIKDQSIFDAASPQSEKIKSISIRFMVAVLAILSLVTGLIIYTTIRFRARGNTTEPKQLTGNKRLEILMVTVPWARKRWKKMSEREKARHANNGRKAEK